MCKLNAMPRRQNGMARSLLSATLSVLERRVALNMPAPLSPPPTAMSYNTNLASPKKAYKSIPENWKALSEVNYQKVISDLESILFDISVDGVNLNSPDGRVSQHQLNRWADGLRAALQVLSKAH